MQPVELSRRELSRIAREEGYTRTAFGPFLRAVLFDYAIIGLTAALVVAVAGTPMLYLLLPLAWLVIASRQHALLILMHDCTHGVAHEKRSVNDLLGELVCASPMAVSMATYRLAHLAHHRAPNTDEDPDLARKMADPEEAATWQFPRAGSAAGGLGRLWWRSLTYLLRSLGDNSAAAGDPPPSSVRGLAAMRLALYALVAVLLTTHGAWGWFLLLWIAPLVLVLPLIMRLRSIAEHFGLPWRTDYDASRTVLAGAAERFLLAPHGINYHLEHHLVASVPFSRLAALHRRFMQLEAYRTRAHITEGYLTGRRPLIRELFQPA